VDRPVDLFGIHIAACHDKMEMDAGEHLSGLSRSMPRLSQPTQSVTFCRPFTQDRDDIVRCASTRCREHGFHGPRPEVATAPLGAPIHEDCVATLGLGQEAYILDPLDSELHLLTFPSLGRKTSP
jgi:hypothetical protein